MAKLKWHPQFAKGAYRSVVETLLEGRRSNQREKRAHLPSLIGALCFLGRHDEAQSLFEIYEKQLTFKEEKAAILFFLALGKTRQSDYESAAQIIEKIGIFSKKTPMVEFFYRQGRSVIFYYTGRLNACFGESQLARSSALASRDLFTKILATDTLGHAAVRLGKIHQGLNFLTEAETLARKIGNEGVANGIALAVEIYEAEFGHKNALEVLEKRFKTTGTEHNFASGEIGLELARQHTLRGDFLKATEILERTSPGIYASKNRRQEIRLNQRLAELAIRKGDKFSARHFLWFSDRVKNQELDREFELINLGIEWKLAQIENNEIEQTKIEKRWVELSRDHSSSRDLNLRSRFFHLDLERENREDLVHVALCGAARASRLADKLKIFLQKNYLIFAAEALKLNAGENTVVILPENLGLIIQSAKGLIYKSQAPSSLQTKMLQQFLLKGELSKEELLTKVWGYSYSPLRHDSLIYAAISALRKYLGDASEWLSVTDGSYYSFKAKIIFANESTQKIKRESAKLQINLFPESSELNFRQMEILAWVRDQGYLSVKSCRDKFKVSEATALRDLRELTSKKYLTKVGKARATRYFEASVEGRV